MSETKKMDENINVDENIKTDALNEAFEQEEKEEKTDKVEEQLKTPEASEKTSVSEKESEPAKKTSHKDEFKGMTIDRDEKKGGRLPLIIGGSILGVLLLVYFGAVLFFQSHYLMNTRLNQMDFSGKSIEQASGQLDGTIEGYTLTISGRDGYQENLKGTDIDLSHKNQDDLEMILKGQNAFLWFVPLFTGDTVEFELKVSYDEAKLNKVVSALTCLQKDRQVAPASAVPVYDGTEYQIQAETLGAKVNTDVLKQAVAKSITTLAKTLNLDEAGCYVAPKYTKDSKEVAEAKETANRWLTASITYSVDGEEVVVDKNQIHEWIKFSDEMKISLNANKVKKFISTLSDTYNSTGKKLKITTPTGKKAKVSGGTYGTTVDEDGEYKKLVKEIRAGEVTTREPKYSQKIAGTKDEPWGETYLEVDLTEQHMWYVQKGEVTFESDVVTGVPIPAKRTPQGVYSVLEKKRNKVLRGEIQANGKPEYVTPVAYWMRVTWTGIGFHDATWQRKFGGQRYKQGYGSHGCINMPYSAIKKLYDMVDKGCPIVVHY